MQLARAPPRSYSLVSANSLRHLPKTAERAVARAEITVAIIGAGLAGCALAIGLRRAGVRVLLLEKRTHFTPHEGAGILLAGNATRALELLGCGMALQTIGRQVHNVTFANQRDETLFTLNCRREAWPPFFSVRHSALRDMLLRHAQLEPTFNVAIEEITSPHSPVIHLADGAQITCDLLVGADGVYSLVRQKLFNASAPIPIDDYKGFRFITKCPAELREPRYLLGNGATLLLYPLPNGEVYCGAGPIAPECLRSATSQVETIKTTFSGFGGVAQAMLDQLDETIHFIPTRYWHVEQLPWVRDRCVLIGDAAHASAPTLAQGAAMAFEDAHALTECIVDHDDIDSALQAFEARRRPRVTSVQHASLERMAANRFMSPHEHWVRDETARRFGERSLEQLWGDLIRHSA